MGWFSWKSLWEFDEVLNRETVSEHLPYRAYDEERGLFYMAHVNNDAIGACWMASPLLGLSDDMLRKFESMFRLVFPEGSTMQFSFLASENIEPLLDRLVAMRRACSPDSPYVVLAEEIRRFYLESQKSSLIPSSKLRPRDFQLFVSIGVPISRSLDTKKALDEEADKVLELVQSIESSLQTGNLSLRRLDDLDLVTLMYFLCNPSHGYEARPHRVQEEEPLNEQMVRFDTVLEQDRDGFTLDGQHVRSLTVQEFPDPEDSTWHGSKNRELIGSLRSIMDQITCRFMITLNVVFLDSMTERTRLSQKHILLTNQYSPTLAKMIPPLAKKKLNFDLAVKQLEDGATSIGAYYHILVFGATAEAVQNYAQTVIQHYAKFNWTVSPDPVISLKLFLHSLPMALPPDVGYLRNSLMRLKTLNSSVLPHLLPVVGDWPGFGDPVCILTSRSGQIVPFDPFSNDSGNYSMCVAGRSGSGKSF
ncbi:MAG: TraC family protein, partial [Nitrospirota bacterium]|nr:TraC family protein [Nitrospirota bacterium]